MGGRYLVSFLVLAALGMPAPGATNPPSTERERQICKRDLMPGSLIRARRLCLTAQEWKQYAETNRQNREYFLSSIYGQAR